LEDKRMPPTILENICLIVALMFSVAAFVTTLFVAVTITPLILLPLGFGGLGALFWIILSTLEEHRYSEK
jgi:hypothetical protein